MRKVWYLAVLPALIAGPALAADPAGDWLVADRTAVIRIAPCGEAYCGTIAWTSVPGTDEHNPDPGKRNRPIVGTQILLGMKPAGRGNRWDGEIYNPENGKTYSGHIVLLNSDLLRIEGCLLFFCSGENWTRAR
jgi:uncharacterized protein (DUF2147 family)